MLGHLRSTRSRAGFARARPTARGWTFLSVAALLAAGLTSVASPGSAGAATTRPDGVGPPVPASGVGTEAALENPRCRHGEAENGPYGRFDSTEVGGGPICVREWKQTNNNGGATAQGVTKDRIVVVAVVPNDQQLSRDPTPPRTRTGNALGNYYDAIYDYLLPQMKFYETWGRDLELKFVTSSGSDEQAQRADLVSITAMKPFAVVNLINRPDLNVLEDELAATRILTMGYAMKAETALEQAPYRWGDNDPQAGALNAAEVLGKQLVDKKAQFGGDDVKNTTRTFGVVSQEGIVDYQGFTDAFRKFGGSVAVQSSFTSVDANEFQARGADDGRPDESRRGHNSGSARGREHRRDRARWRTRRSRIGTRSGSSTAPQYADLGILARGYPAEQSQHAFGISFLSPWTEPDTTYSTHVDPVNWYWGEGSGTYTARLVAPFTYWLLSGIHAAGPKLTPKTFEQGLFSIPPQGGGADNAADSGMHAFGKGPQLPYNEYALSGYDFAPYWWDPETSGPSNGLGTIGAGVGFYVEGAKRYFATQWPKKQFAWFNESQSLTHFTSPQTPQRGYAGDCESCPSTGSPGQPGAPSKTAIIFRAGGEGASAA